jgi:hypothetical protein
MLSHNISHAVTSPRLSKLTVLIAKWQIKFLVDSDFTSVDTTFEYIARRKFRFQIEPTRVERVDNRN